MQRQIPSTTGWQDQCIHPKAWDVGQATWSRKYWFLWESGFAETSDTGATIVIPCLKEHISSLRGFFQKFFPNNSAQYWVRSIQCSTTCWFQLYWRGPVHWDDVWLHPEAEVYSTDTECILAWCGEGASTHRAEGCEDSASVCHILSLWDGLSCCCLTENRVQIYSQQWTWLKSGIIKPATPFGKDAQCKTISLQPLSGDKTWVLTKWLANLSCQVSVCVIFGYRLKFINFCKKGL